MSISTGPSSESVYFNGSFLQLYAHPPPDSPGYDECGYEPDATPMTQISNRFNASIAERASTPVSPPDVSITLDKRLVSSTRRVSHVWTARAHNSSTQHTYPSIVVAKVYDPVYFDSEGAECFDPFALRDLFASSETESYRHLERLQGAKVPRFYGHFVAPLPSQQGRTVNVVLMEYIDGWDIRAIVPAEQADNLCGPHKSTLIESVLRLDLTIRACGIFHKDLQPRNVILRNTGQHATPFCLTAGCPLRTKADSDSMMLVMVDFEQVEFREQRHELWDPVVLTVRVETLKPKYLKRWLVNGLL